MFLYLIHFKSFQPSIKPKYALKSCLKPSSHVVCLQEWSAPYVVEGGALHGLVLLQGVHLVQVAVSDEQGPVLRLVETVDLGKQQSSSTLGEEAAGFLCLCRRTCIL